MWTVLLLIYYYNKIHVNRKQVNLQILSFFSINDFSQSAYFICEEPKNTLQQLIKKVLLIK